MIISHSSLLLFVTGAAIMLVIPGPAVTYIVSRSIAHGRAAGLVSVLGHRNVLPYPRRYPGTLRAARLFRGGL